MDKQLKNIREEMNAEFIERESLITGFLCGLLCGEHILIIGPPGTGKSMIAAELCSRLNRTKYFHWLLTKFTTPEELFGPVSIKALENNSYERITTFKLPRAHIVFLDEIFKSNSSILNTLLTIMNERIFFNGNKAVKVPLITMVGACNSFPDSEELIAFYDRFLLKYTIDYIEEDDNFSHMLTTEPPHRKTRISLKGLYEMQKMVRKIPFDKEAIEKLVCLRSALGEKGVIVSDRKYKQCIDLIKARAYLEGSDKIEDIDFDVLKDSLWNNPSDKEIVREIISKQFFPLEYKTGMILGFAREIKKNYQSQEGEPIKEVRHKLNELSTKMKGYEQEASSGFFTRDISRMFSDFNKIKEKLLNNH